MGNLINPWLVEGYVDEQDTSSAQGCYIGADILWEGEEAADKALKAERERLSQIRNLKILLSNLEEELIDCSPHHYRKRERLEKRIAKLKRELELINKTK